MSELKCILTFGGVCLALIVLSSIVIEIKKPSPIIYQIPPEKQTEASQFMMKLIEDSNAASVIHGPAIVFELAEKETLKIYGVPVTKTK